MKLLPVAVLLFVTPVIPLSVEAQEPVRRDPRAIAMLQQSLSSMAGNAGFGGILDVTIEADLVDLTDAARTTRSMRVSSRGPQAIRWEIQGPEGQTVSLFTSQGAVVRGRGDEHGLRGSNAQLSVAQLPLFFVAETLTSPAVGLQFGDVEVKDGRTLDRIIITRQRPDGVDPAVNPHRNRSELLIDRATLLPAGVVLYIDWGFDMRVSFPLHVEFGDFTSVGQRLIPFTVRTKWGTNVVQELRVRSATFNTGIPDSVFR